MSDKIWGTTSSTKPAPSSFQGSHKLYTLSLKFSLLIGSQKCRPGNFEDSFASSHLGQGSATGKSETSESAVLR